MAVESLSRAQRELVIWIIEETKRTGSVPSRASIAAHLNRSPAAATARVNVLVRMDWLEVVGSSYKVLRDEDGNQVWHVVTRKSPLSGRKAIALASALKAVTDAIEGI